MKDERETSNTEAHDFVTMEHVISLLEGGTSEQENLVASCSLCNNHRPKDMSAVEWYEYIQENGRPDQIYIRAKKQLRGAIHNAIFKEYGPIYIGVQKKHITDDDVWEYWTTRDKGIVSKLIDQYVVPRIPDERQRKVSRP